MDLTFADQRILIFPTQLTFDDAQDKAWSKKMDAFGTITKLVGFLNKPQDSDFELVYKEYRYEPFWHVVATAKYVYERNTGYEVRVSGTEVKSVTYSGTDFDVVNGHIHLNVLEHCQQIENEEVLVDGVTGKSEKNLKQYLSLSPKQVTDSIEKEAGENSILIPPQVRISAIMRDSLAKMIKGIQADKIIEETLKVECVDLYYHPVYAFKYMWKSKAKEAIILVDGLTGNVSVGDRVFKEYLGKMLDKNFLFDLGADAAGVLIPGGSIAVKIAKKYVDSKESL